MKTFRHFSMAIVLCTTIAYSGYGQVPDLGAAAGFALFTAAGAFEVSGNSTTVTGDVGTNVGAFTGFPPGVLLGTIHVTDEVTAQAAQDVLTAYAYLAGLTCGQVLTSPLGNGQALAPNIYCLGGASTLNGDLILDGQNDPDAVFVFQINGAFATSTNTNIVLINSASLCNVFWQINGAFSLGEGSNFYGTVINGDAIHLLEGANLTGSALSTAGAIDLHNNVVTIVTQPIAPTIIANGPVEICIGESVTLSGNVDGTWSTGETTPTITVFEAGDYYVTAANECGSDLSNVITVIVNPLPIISISGETAFCLGESTTLTATEGVSYLWSTNETTQSISVSQAGTYSVIVTDNNGCEGYAQVYVTVYPLPIIYISGETEICEGESTVLTATAGASYLWSTTETTQSITVSTPGTYSVEVTDLNGCVGSAQFSVSFFPYTIPSCPPNMNVLLTDAPVALTGGTPGGGVYSGPGITGNIFNPASVGLGTYIITYTIQDICGAQTCNFIIIVTEEAIICEDAVISNFPTAHDVSVGEPYSIDFSNVVVENAIEEIWVVTPLAGVIVDGIFTLNAGYVGEVTITLTAVAEIPCTDDQESISFTVHPIIYPTGPPNMIVSITDSPFVLTGGSPEGGVYSGNGVTGNTFNPAEAGLGVHTITYTIENFSGPQTYEFTITVSQEGAPPPIPISSWSLILAIGLISIFIIIFYRRL